MKKAETEYSCLYLMSFLLDEFLNLMILYQLSLAVGGITSLSPAACH